MSKSVIKNIYITSSVHYRGAWIDLYLRPRVSSQFVITVHV